MELRSLTISMLLLIPVPDLFFVLFDADGQLQILDGAYQRFTANPPFHVGAMPTYFGTFDTLHHHQRGGNPINLISVLHAGEAKRLLRHACPHCDSRKAAV